MSGKTFDGTVMAVASPGGHLDELLTLITRFLPARHGVVWVTAETAQTRSLLANQRVEWVREVGARQGVNAARSFTGALRLIRRHRPAMVVSTGAALSFPYILAARLHRVETHFIDSATRLAGPSLTGRLAQAVPGMHLHTQGVWEHGGRWMQTTSVFDSYSGVDWPSGSVKRILVTVGSERFPFSRGVQVIARSIPAGADVTWQLGHTPPPAGLPGSVHQWLPFDDMVHHAEEADVVITHCGVGSVLMALRAGRCPVVLARQAADGEHVDDHQAQLAAVLDGAGIAFVAPPEARNVRALVNLAAKKRATKYGA